MKQKIERLRSLMEKATPGEWHYGGWLVWNWSTRDWDYLKGQSDD